MATSYYTNAYDNLENQQELQSSRPWSSSYAYDATYGQEAYDCYDGSGVPVATCYQPTYENYGTFDEYTPISPSSSTSSASPLTPAYHHAPLLFTKLDSPIEEGLLHDEGVDKSGTTTSNTRQAYGYDAPSVGPCDPPISCLSPAQTQLISPPPPYTLEIKQPQPKPIIPVISLAALASQASDGSPSPNSPRSPPFISPSTIPRRPVLTLSCSVPAPPTLLSPLDFALGLPTASYPDVFPLAYQEEPIPPCPCAACMGCYGP
ncbi:hypothetical protein MIND_00525300 [Mycena indigotica]|uniref:Uncharacterized protein n=1 Tax=Mycena indigotica TaxID=2126181 RepID=A0A8H6SXX2_9AGAR|nr:uncharacterized protein MIND_00525300 [Mycena indigotica]KAF7307313.1 hypothetical protein MIND_00525300 [Mycena indigotica]